MILVRPRRHAVVGVAATAVAAVVVAALYLRPSSAGSSAAPAAPSAVPVPVVTLAETEVTTWDEFSGRLEAVERVDVRSRVAGAVKSIHFVEGALVQRGDLLVTIDPDPYAAEVDRAQAQVVAAQARLTYSRSEHARAERLWRESAIAQRELDERVNAEQEADANQRAAQAGVPSARLNLGYTQIRAPVAGRRGGGGGGPRHPGAAGPAAPGPPTPPLVNPL